ncbi:hypothetical protein AAHA92_14136 [Salvia divinorum]|uniref:Uncharacterized protein n=1 Tax=Salvia divinorum TaxID=28513 RepID=A0ABD1HDX4_SALDI
MASPVSNDRRLSLSAFVNWINSQLSSPPVEELSSRLASEKQRRLPPTYGVERSDNSLADSASNGPLSRLLLRNAAIAVTGQSASSLPAPRVSSVVGVAVVVRLLGQSRLIPKLSGAEIGTRVVKSPIAEVENAWRSRKDWERMRGGYVERQLSFS